MPIVEYAGVRCELLARESVLDGLLRAGISVPHSCKAGSCGSCLMRSESGAIPEQAQRGLKESWKAKGYFLACVCQPNGDLVAGAVGTDARVPAAIRSLDWLSATVLRVRLVCEQPFEFHAGQYVALVRQDGLARSYSIASLPDEPELELHVRVLADGKMSQWLAREAQPGMAVSVQGPAGDCFYVPSREDQPMVLAGTGTGLAPLWGIARDALRRGHRGPMHLFHGAATEAGFYLQPQLAALAREHANFNYTATAMDADGAIDKVVLPRQANWEGWRAFLCGDPGVVQSLRKKLFLAGAALNDIHADAFLASA